MWVSCDAAQFKGNFVKSTTSRQFDYPNAYFWPVLITHKTCMKGPQTISMKESYNAHSNVCLPDRHKSN